MTKLPVSRSKLCWFMKNLFKKILCPIDFDENSIAALDAARDLAVDPNATVWVLYVVRLALLAFQKSSIHTQ